MQGFSKNSTAHWNITTRVSVIDANSIKLILSTSTTNAITTYVFSLLAFDRTAYQSTYLNYIDVITLTSISTLALNSASTSNTIIKSLTPNLVYYNISNILIGLTSISALNINFNYSITSTSLSCKASTYDSL
jgi:hypothetical protein